MSMIELIVKKDDREINRYFLPQGVTTLGRAEDNTIILDDSCVSRKHARIKVEGGRVSIEDLGSGNGMFDGDQRIERKDLVDGDVIVIEPFQLLLRKDANPQKVVDSTRPVPSAPSPRASRIDAPPSRAARQPGGSAAGGPRLEVVRGEGGPFLLSGEPSSIGRSDEAKITLKDPSSSRKHAEVSNGPRGWILKDLGSANGTYLNGAPVKDSVLADGDIILIGNTELRFVDPSAQEAAQQPVTPPPKTSPVAREKKPSRPPPRRMEPEPEPEPDSAGMEMGGDYDGGAMRSTGSMPPMDMPSAGGTDVGGAPPPAWGNGSGSSLEATGEGEAQDFGGADDLNGGYDNGGEEFGMELGEDALFPGGERPPDSVVGKFIFSFKTNRVTQLVTIIFVLGFFFMLVIAKKGQGDGGKSSGPKFVQKLDRKQEITLSTMQQDKKDAAAYLDPTLDKKDTTAAFQKYYQIITFGSAPEMANVRQAQVLKQEAIDNVYTLHEYLIIQTLGKATKQGEILIGQTKARVDRDRKECAMQLDLGKRRGKGSGAVAAYSAAINACNDLLQVLPTDAEATSNLNIAKSERYKLVGELNANALEDLKKKCQAQMDRALAKFNLRSPKGFQDAIKEYEKVGQIDATEQTQFPAAARSQINVAKKKLADAARPLRDSATQYQNKQDWIPARRAIRQAIAINPFDVTLDEQKEKIQIECLKNAARQLQEAKVYINAENYSEAKKAVTLALQYADEEGTKENKSGRELLKQIQRNTETPK